jgi:hypothetical protein
MSSVAYGANIAFIEELYEKFRSDPQSVSASWREFFEDYDPQLDTEDAEEEIEQRVAAVGGSATAAIPVARAAAPAPAPTPAPATPRPTPVPASPASAGTPVALRGAASKIVANMESSLTVPTATSIRNIPVKVLEENRRVINNHLTLIGQSKASFTHIIAWALVQAVQEVPAHERRLRDAGQRSDAHRSPRREPRHRHRSREERRHALADGPEHQTREHAGLRAVPQGLQRRRPQGAQQSARNLRLRRHDALADESRHARHDRLGAAPDADAGHDHRHRLRSITPPNTPHPIRACSPTSASRR